MTVIDLFAGPGGWDLAARELGLDPLGIEHDDAACATREAAGLRTLQADVAALDPADFAPCVGLIASPPCQAFSSAGKGEGRGAIDDFKGAMLLMADGQPVDWVAIGEACGDERAHLVLEPLRWALALAPRWIALEQVPPVLPLWEAMAVVLRSRGYSAATAILSAETFGVPQTRKRAFLLASLDGPVSMPRPTHARYIAPRRREVGADCALCRTGDFYGQDCPECDNTGRVQPAGLFTAPEPERIVAPEDRGLLPWVSMAEALGWGLSARPSTSVVCSSEGGGSPEARCMDGGSGTRQTIRDARERGEWALRAGTNANDASRAADEPAPTLRFGARLNDVSWVSNALPNAATRSADESAPTITGGHDHNERRWVSRRPAPTILGSRRSSEGLLVGKQMAAGHKVNGDDIAAGRDGYEGRAGENAVRVTLQEALVLQSFPSDYPVQGTRTAQYRQVGDALCPLLAWHVLKAIPAELDREKRDAVADVVARLEDER